MEFTAYVCEDFEFIEETGDLIIFDIKAKFTSNESNEIIKFISKNCGMYNALVCPQLFLNKNNKRVERVIFK